MSKPKSDEAAIRQVIRAFRNADGYEIVGGHDGEEDFSADAKTPENSLIESLMACDDSTLHVKTPAGALSFVYFVLGNEPDEVICDHGVSLSPVLDPLTERWDD